jgi:hypothetical protein
VTPITTTVYDAQVTNLNGGTADEGITYSIKGINADKFSITLAKYHIRFTCIGVYRISTNNQIIPTITIDITCCRDSSAGDVNGDGLDVMIIGAFLADMGHRANAGKS